MIMILRQIYTDVHFAAYWRGPIDARPL